LHDSQTDPQTDPSALRFFFIRAATTPFLPGS